MDTREVASEALRPAVELVALLASAGGLDPLTIVLRDLATDFPAAVVVQQHLGGHSSVLPSILAGRTPHRVEWVHDGQVVAPGRVLVCPPGMHLEVEPDGSCCLRPMDTLSERRFDVLLASLADSYGPRGLAVVLSGSGRDGAAGTAAMKRAGAVVIAQSPDTAEYPSMPIAAARAGAALMPVCEIGRVLTQVVEAGADRLETYWIATPLHPLMERTAQETDRNTSGSGMESMDTVDATVVNGPAARAEAARLRVAELRRRRHDLAEGFGATPQTVATARRRAQESLHRAQQAQRAAARRATDTGH